MLLSWHSCSHGVTTGFSKSRLQLVRLNHMTDLLSLPSGIDCGPLQRHPKLLMLLSAVEERPQPTIVALGSALLQSLKAGTYDTDLTLHGPENFSLT